MNLHDEIARIACELYEKSGRVEGRDEENWLEAERIIMARTAKKSGGTEKTPKSKKPARTSSRKAEVPKKTPAKRKKKTG